MPTVVKPTPAVRPKPAAKAPPGARPGAARPKPNGRPVKFPDLRVEMMWGQKALTADKAMTLLGWEDEEAYNTRTGKQDGYGEEFLLEDENGKKVRCWNNDRNRPFDLGTAKKYAQEILARKWAGPTTMPGETVNGETVIIGRTARVESGQHRLIGLVLAKQMWEKQQAAYKDKWPTEPILESLVVFGVSENPTVVQTLDNVKPRVLSDVFYTLNVFDDPELKTAERRELAKMLDSALDLLWKRTRAGDTFGYQTHSTSTEFKDRHPKIVDCVLHIFEENKDRGISKLKLSAGQCAGLMYLMAASQSDIDSYLANRAEKTCDLSSYDRAAEFFAELADDKKSKVAGVRIALGRIVDGEEGAGGRVAEKHGILCKAWKVWAQGDSPSETDVALEYATDDEGVVHLVEWPTVDGIDQGDPIRDKEKEKPASKEEVEEEKKKARKLKAKKAEEKAKQNASPGMLAVLGLVREKHPGKLLLFADRDGKVWNAWDDDAKIVSTDLDLKAFQDKENEWVLRCMIPAEDLQTSLPMLRIKGSKVALVEVADDGDLELPNGVRIKVTDTAAPKVAPKPAPKVKPQDANVNGAQKPAAKPAAKVKPKLRGGMEK